jgi:beta-lactamase regulating signal transducer with metallopeptidase domain/protocatechuate 3,4-dioxygenase beta subunit
MMSVMIAHANSAGDRWTAWVVAGLLDSALLLGVIGLIWSAIRHRVAPQVGYCLFLLVPLKLIVPVVVTLPDAIARRTPSALMASWLERARAIERAEVPPSPTVRIVAVRADAPVPAGPRLDPLPATRSTAPASSAPGAGSSGVAPAPRSLSADAVGTPPRLSLSAIAMIGWVAGVLLLLGRLIWAQRGFRTRIRRLPSLDPASLPVDWRELCQLAGVAPAVRIVEDGSIAAPAVWGIVRPTLIMPPGVDSTLTPPQLRWVLLHELAHVGRRDLLVVAFQRLASIVHFFNPAVWVANRMIDRLREYACDDLAASLGRSSALESGEAFVKILRHADRGRRGLGGALGVFGFDSRSSCLLRVRRLLNADRPIRSSPGPWSLAALILLAIVALPRVRGAVEPAPAVAQEPAKEKAIAPVPKAAESLMEFELTVVGPGGKPIPEALVEIWGRPAGPADPILRGAFVRKARLTTVAKADADGKLTVLLPTPLERFNLSIAIPGFGPYWASWRTEDHDPPIPARFTAELDRAWSVGGIIVDPEGKPVEGVKVEPWIEFKKRPGDHGQMYSGASATTDAAGRWRYDSVPDSLGEVYVAIDHPDFGPVRRNLARAEFGIQGGKEPSAKLALDRGLTVTGHVADDEGKPIADALIRTKFHNEIRETRTGADGSYRLLGCETKPTRIVASAKGRATDLKELNIEPGMGPVDFQLKPGGTVRIRVLDEHGKPAARARIFFQQWRGRFDYYEFDHINQYADANGIWEWHEAPLDEFRADICPPDGDGMQLVREPLIARAEEYVFRLPPTLVISGKVVDAATKQPIKTFRVIPGVRFSETNMMWRDRDGFSASDGRYEVRQTRGEMAHLVRIEADGYQAASSRDIKSTEGNVTIDFELTRGNNVVAKVVTPDLQPASGARVALGVAGSQIQVKNGEFNRNGTFCEQTTADAAGRFRFAPQDQDFQILITHPTGYSQIRSTPEWDQAKVIRLEPWARVEGTFRVGRDAVANAPIELDVFGRDSYGEGAARISSQHLATTGPDGRFAFDRVIPGRGRLGRRIVWMVNEGATEVTSSCKVAAEFPAGKTFRIDLGGTGRAVVGKLQPMEGTDAKTVRWNFASVMARPEPNDPPASGPHLTASVARDGTFRIDDVPAGNYSLSIWSDRGGAGSLRDHRFSVPTADVDPAAGPVDLGTLKLQAVGR